MSEGRRWLVCAGVNDYGGQVELPNLHGAVNGACLIYRILRDEYNFEGLLLAQSRDIADGPFAALAPESAGPGAREEIIDCVGDMRRQMGPDDVFLFYFSGHGLADGPGYMAPFGSKFDKTSTYLMYRHLFAELSSLPCRRQALFFDCCYSGKATASSGAGGGATGPDAPRVVAFASTSDAEASPGRIPGLTMGDTSPFTQALADFLQQVEVGASFDPEDLFQWLKQKTPARIPANWTGFDPTPTWRAEVPEIRRGRGEFRLRRPGLSLDVPPCLQGRAGDPLPLPLRAQRRGRDGEPLQWTVAASARTGAAESPGGAEKYAVEQDGETCVLSFAYAGDYVFEVTARDPDTDETTRRALHVRVLAPVQKPLTVDPTPLPICWKGDAYEGRVGVSGGAPPYEIEEAAGLPEGLEAEIAPPGEGEAGSWAVSIRGRVRPAVEPGTANCRNPIPIGHGLRFAIRDRAREARRFAVRLLVLDKGDYCLLDRGPFEVGYTRSAKTDGEVSEAVQKGIQAIARIKGAPGANVDGALHAVSAAQANQIAEELLQCNPGSKGDTPTFYMRRYPVTNFEWREFIRATGKACVPSHWALPAPTYFDERAQGTLPVVNIKYEWICEYLEWRGTRLPTAWEWERAARGKEGWFFPWGNEFDFGKCNILGGRAQPGLTPVDTFDHADPDLFEPDATEDGRSAAKVCDLIGNAAEWVDRRVYQKVRGRDALVQPFRGGSFLDPVFHAFAFRDSREAGVIWGADEEERSVGETSFRWLGFRDVVDLDPAPEEAQGVVPIPASSVVLDGESVATPDFEMARYAVSNLEYLEFVLDTGHRRPDHWDAESEYPFPSFRRFLPVVNVSYRDALAFCLWKSRQTGKIVRLPRPEQWLAALGRPGPYPWGADFDPQRCNSLTSGWGKRLPVFALPHGRGPAGVYNLVGNVWEWVRPDEIRGGSWRCRCEGLPRTGFCARIRDADPETGSRSDIGFRYVVNHPPEP